MELKEVTSLEADNNGLRMYRMPDYAIDSALKDESVKQLSFLSIPYDNEVVVAATGKVYTVP